MHERMRDPRVRRVAVMAVSAAATLGLPAVAGAATRTVEVGPFGKANQRAFQGADADADAFFRRVTTIHRGDTVSWEFNGFHTVTFVPRGDIAPGLITPDAAHPVAGSLDAAGAPFWFNGQARLVFNQMVAAKQGGTTFRPDALHNSGVPLSEGPPPPYRLKFNRTGRFQYLCVVHPGMRGTVRVVGRAASVPSAARHRREAHREQKTLLRRAQRLTTGLGTTRLINTAQAGNDDRDGAAIFKFFPQNLKVKTGTTVQLRMARRTTEAHTFSFGPTNGTDGYLDQLAAGFVVPMPNGDGPPTILIDPRAGYPSESPPAGVPSYDGANHGNGFYNSGVLDRDPHTPSPGGVRVTFTRAGTYQYICLIHPFMRGQVTVAD